MNTGSRGRRIPVWVVTGFLGTGKTSLLNSILNGSHGLRFAVLVNEFGHLGIDAALIEDRAASLIEVANGCICCSSHGDLALGLDQLLSVSDRFDGLLIETSGLAQPLGVADVLYSDAFCERVELAAILTVVDTANFDTNLDNAVVAFQQLMAADLLMLNKVDLVDADTADLIQHKLGQLNRSAGIVPTTHGAVPIEIFANEEMCSTPTRLPAVANCVHPAEVGSVSHEIPGSVDRALFTAWIAGLPPSVWRVKALVRFGDDGGWFVYQRVGMRESLTQLRSTTALSVGRIVFIGKQLDYAALTESLQRCRTRESRLHATIS